MNMTPGMRRIIRIFLLAPLFIIAACASPCAIVLNPIDALKTGDSVSIAPLKTIDGRKINLASHKGKKVVIVAFWLHTCDSCIDDFKTIEKFLAKEKRSRDVAVITVTRGMNDTEIEFLKGVIKRNKIKFPVVIDPELDVTRSFGVTQVPAYALIDKKGKLATPVFHYPEEKIRDYSLLEMVDMARKGKPIPRIQFIEYTRNPKLRAMIGKAAPPLSIKSLDGKTYDISQYKGKINALVVFWHPYCTYCSAQLERLATYYSENRQKYNFVLLTVASIFGDAQLDEANAFLDKTGRLFPILNDDGSAAGAAYNIEKIPTLFFIDTNGIIRDAGVSDIFEFEEVFNPIFESFPRKKI